MFVKVTAELNVSKQFVLTTKVFLEILVVNSNFHCRRIVEELLEALFAVVEHLGPEQTILNIVRFRLDTFGLEFQLDNRGAKLGIETNIRMFNLGLSEDGFNDDILLLFVYLQVFCLFDVETFFVKKLSVAN